MNRFNRTKAGLSVQTGRAINVLFDVLSARAGRGDQAEGDRPANTTVLFLQDNPRLRQDAGLFTCIQFRYLFVLRPFLTRLMNGSLEFILSSIEVIASFPPSTRMFSLLI